MSDVPEFLDWRHGLVDDPAPCVICRRPALMRDPGTGLPTHKVCAEAQLVDRRPAESEAA